MKSIRKILLVLSLTVFGAGMVSAYADVQRVSIDEIRTLEPSSFFMLKTDEGPIWIVYRNPQVVEHLLANPAPGADADNLLRSLRQDILVVRPRCSCTGLTARYLEPGHPALGGFLPAGFVCENDVSLYDMAGRVVSSTCGASDFAVPGYKVIDEKYIEIDPDDS